jgi:hypothetical protein
LLGHTEGNKPGSAFVGYNPDVELAVPDNGQRERGRPRARRNHNFPNPFLVKQFGGIDDGLEEGHESVRYEPVFTHADTRLHLHGHRNGGLHNVGHVLF